MNMDLDYGARDVVLYIARMLRCFKASKLMTTVFLAQYDVEWDAVYEYRCGGRPLARAEFYIWSHGPVSDEVYDVLGDFDAVSGEFGLELCYGGPAPQLPQPVVSRLSDVAAKYGNWKNWQVERHVKRLLGLDIPERLSDYVGYWLYTYLHAEGFRLEIHELCGKL